MRNKKLRVLVAGSGGQGILTLGRLLAYAAIHRQWSVSCLPTYGAEMRGGYVYCLIVISGNRGIFSPVSGQVDIGLFMHERMLRLLRQNVKPEGTLLLNSSLIQGEQELTFKKLFIPASEMAESLGNLQVANMVMGGALGCLISQMFLPLEMADLISGIEQAVGKKEARETSEKALWAGWRWAEEKWKS
ncbi:MAG: 2-oxoacid:acceptor oxidoreductase family protein [Candidatus Omnitrophica bacterium]|nr:2-oxoacid:acceptor oxidoreductase family protein [Candidatus Omnitrophota bacterium]